MCYRCNRAGHTNLGADCTFAPQTCGYSKCKKTGHHSDRCKMRLADEGRARAPTSVQANTVQIETQPRAKSYHAFAATHMQSSSSTQRFLLDSAASAHIVSSMVPLASATLSDARFRAANGELMVPPVYNGSIALRTADGGTLDLHDVYSHHQMPANLISVGALLEAGYDVTFKKKRAGAIVTDDDGRILFTADYNDGVFVINTVAVRAAVAVHQDAYVQHIVHPTPQAPGRGVWRQHTSSKGTNTARSQSSKPQAKATSCIGGIHGSSHRSGCHGPARANQPKRAPTAPRAQRPQQSRSAIVSPPATPRASSVVRTTYASILAAAPSTKLHAPSASSGPAARAAPAVAAAAAATAHAATTDDPASRWITVGRDRRSRSHSPRSASSSSSSSRSRHI